MTAGPAVTALLLLVASLAEILAVNGATFLASAALLVGVPLGLGDAADRDAASLWSATRAGPQAAVEIPGVAALLVIGAISVYGAGMVTGSVVNARADPTSATCDAGCSSAWPSTASG